MRKLCQTPNHALTQLHRNAAPLGLDFCVATFLHRCHPYGVLFIPVLSVFLQRCHPYGVLFIPVLSVFLHRCHPYGVGFVVVVVFLHRCHPYGVCLWCYRCFLRSIPSPKIVGARSPRPDENIADASAPISLQGGRSLNSGRGNPAPTEPRRESYLKILLHTPDRDVTPTGFYGAGTYIATQMPHIRGSIAGVLTLLHR